MQRGLLECAIGLAAQQPYTEIHTDDRANKDPLPQRKHRNSYCRAEAAGHLRGLNSAQNMGISERGYARQVGVARSTMRNWAKRRRELQSAGVPAFFDTEEGGAWVDRLVWSLVFVMSLRCLAGLRVICEALELSGLEDVVASSFGSIQAMALTLLDTVDIVGAELQADLAAKVEAHGEKKCITICPDETFHPAICLVAKEPVSDFILVEEGALASTSLTAVQRRQGRGYCHGSSY